METSNFLQSVAAGNAAEAKDMLNDLLSARAFEALDAKKVELAQSLFGDKQEEVEQEETVEIQDTEETAE